jgi:hypothetical protein
MFWIFFCPLLALVIAGLIGLAGNRSERRWRLALDAFACEEMARAEARGRKEAD